MGRKRIIFQNWIVDLGRDPDLKHPQTGSFETVSIDSGLLKKVSFQDPRDLTARKADREELQAEVQKALEKLTEEEQEFIRQFHFMGKSYREISEQSGRAVYRLEALNRRAIKKLRKSLAGFVERRFNLKIEETPLDGSSNCPICSSPARKEIDRLISVRNLRQSWRPVIREIQIRHDLIIKSPQILIGHEKYHR